MTGHQVSVAVGRGVAASAGVRREQPRRRGWYHAGRAGLPDVIGSVEHPAGRGEWDGHVNKDAGPAGETRDVAHEG